MREIKAIVEGERPVSDDARQGVDQTIDVVGTTCSKPFGDAVIALAIS